MKTYKKALAFMLVLLMTFSLTVFAYTEETDYEEEVNLIEEPLQEDMDNEDEIVFVEDLLQDEVFVNTLYQHMLETYGEVYMQNLSVARSQVDKIHSSLPASRMGEIIYSDTSGGIYINDDGNLVVLFTHKARERNVNINNYLGGLSADDVIIRYVEFSDYELNNVMHILNTYRRNNPDCEITNNFNVFYTDTINNRVVVNLDEYSEDRIEEFKKNVLDTPIITFKESLGPSINFTLVIEGVEEGLLCWNEREVAQESRDISRDKTSN